VLLLTEGKEGENRGRERGCQPRGEGEKSASGKERHSIRKVPGQRMNLKGVPE